MIETKERIKNFRSDSGGELFNQQLTVGLRSRRIKMQTTVADSPQTNGESKRMNQTILSKVCCTLVMSGLPQKVWAELSALIVYLNHRIPKDGLTQLEKIFDKKPNYKRVVVLGSLIIMKKQRSNKLSPKCIERYIVGYNAGKIGFRVWNSLNDDILVPHDYSIHEDTLYKSIHGSKIDNVNDQLISDEQN
jgi:hypothetical protein